MNIVETPAPGGTLLTLYKEKQPVGSCLLCPQAEGVRIERLEIDPAWRRRGYGSYLLRQALHRTGGLLAACLYSGGPNGDGEKKAVLAWLERLPLTRYTVLEARFANWAETAPLPCFVLKNP